MMQTALEAEVDAFLGRPATSAATWTARQDAATAGSHRRVSRRRWARSSCSVLLRGTDQAFCSRLFGAGVTRTNALESLVISGWVRGLSDRDIEATLAEVLGPEAALSKSTASRICQRIGEEFSAWRARDSSGAAGLPVPGRQPLQDAPRRPGRAGPGGVGITTDGKPVFVGLGPAASESTDAWDDFLSDLVGRGLGAPLLGISDGAAGLTGAFDRAFRRSLRQRCLVHRARNVLAKVSSHDHDERSAATTGRSSTSAMPNPATTRSASRERRPRRSRPSGARATCRRSPASPATWRRSRCTCGSRPNTGTASVTPTLSSGPSARLVDGPK